ncbi:MAG: formate dehydrogenase subunit gamma, partial [Opitutales bacterium]
ALAVCFLVAMGTGLGLYWRSILSWTLPLYGGKPMAVNLHYWFGLGLGLTTALLFLVWRAAARWTPADTHFVKHLTQYAARPDQQPPAETGFFNGGQKLYFWAVVGSTLVLVLTGIVWWYRQDMPHTLYAVCRTTHRVLAVLMSGALLVHVYKATIGEPGTLRSMIRGTVTTDWARTRRPKWFRDLGRGE